MNVVHPGLHGAFMANGFGRGPAVPATDQALAGLRLAVKDVFEVEGLRMGAGNPAWFESEAPARHTAPAVRLLLQAGAQWVGKTVTDELTYSLAGVNAHYGTPTNPAAPGRLPGGSSSGSAVAVAAGHADVGLGTDCGGSIRLPASYCGIWGLRPTHGQVPAQGCIALAHSFDTPGWLTRDLATLTKAWEVLTHQQVPDVALDTLECLVADDVGAQLDAGVRSAFEQTVQGLGASLKLRRLPPGTLALADWAQALRCLQANEVWQQHGDWFQQHGHTLGADVRARFEAARAVDAPSTTAAQSVRAAASATLAGLLAPPGRLLLLPATPSPAPALGDSMETVNDIRSRSQLLLCMAGLAGLPQVSMPWIRIDGAPVGLSLVARRGDDALVLAAAAHLARRLAGPSEENQTP